MKEILLRYIKMENSGIESYFDADEIIELLDHFDETSDYVHYQKVLELGQKLHPNNTEIQIRLCKLYVHKKEYRNALRLIDKIGDHDSQELYLLKLECFCATDKYNDVTAFIDTHQLEDNALEEIFECIAQVLNDLKKEEEVYDFVKRGLERFPNNLILKEEQCYYLEIKRETKAALQICQELIDHNPYSVEYWYTQGRLYFIEGQYGDAIDSFDFALTCDESVQEVKIKKAYCLFINKNYEKAIEVYLELLSEDNSLYERVQPYLAECYMYTANFEKAYLIFRDIFKEITIADNLPVYKNYIRCCIETEREAEAENNVLKIAEKYPRDLLLLWLQSFIHIVRNEHDEAVQTLLQFLQKLYQTSLNKENIESLNETITYLSFDSNIKDLLIDAHSLMGERFDEPFEAIHQAVGSLIAYDITQFCLKYEQCSAEITNKYIDQILLYAEALQTYESEQEKSSGLFLRSKDIIGYDQNIASDDLSSAFLKNKHHYN